MGKNTRERKLTKVQQTTAERQAIAERRKDRLQPTLRILRRLIAATLATGVLLYVGTMVNQHLATWVEKVMRSN